MAKEIDLLKEIADITSCTTGDDLSGEDAQNVLDLIESQRQEIENLKVCLEAEEKYAEGLNRDIKSLLDFEPNNDFIGKNKIKEMIEEIEKYKGNTVEKSTINEYECAINFLKELLEE